jgi:hypothetical protein
MASSLSNTDLASTDVFGRGSSEAGFASAATSPVPGTCASDVTLGRKTGGSAVAACARITASAASSAPSSWPSSLGMMPPSSSTILTVASCWTSSGRSVASSGVVLA